MIRHNHEIMDCKLSSLYIGAQNFDEEICHPLGLEQGSATGGSSRYEECTRSLCANP